MISAGANKVMVSNEDYLSLNPQDDKYSNVRVVLLDPSCSGSGMNHSIVDGRKSDATENIRLQSLSQFQLKALLHSMKFPNAERITYSTCSIFEAENENVVAEALRLQEEPATDTDIGRWELKARV